MSTESALAPPIQALPDSPAPKKTLNLPNVQPKQTSSPIHELELLLSSPASHATIPSIHLQPTASHDYDAASAMPQSGEAEDEYTLSAYGDISLSEVIVPPLPPTHPSPLQPRFPQPRLRPKVRRPPMPKRRLSYTYIPDPLSHNRGMDHDDRWPGSPRPFANKSTSYQHQPLASSVFEEPTTPRTRRSDSKPVGSGASSLERIFDELVPRSPSIRLSPPGSPANQAIALPQETREPGNGVRQRHDAPNADAAKLSQMSPTPAPRQNKPKETPWRTRLPPRPPIPKWDV